ncbi:MAG TPA: hypothetical protein DC057_10050 [Spirochaetia bacterium]|nr:hypothetical protein [Spirochaetia bacterium]
MTTKFSGRYCFEIAGENTYCIPIELKSKFDNFIENIVETELTEKFEKIKLFELTFKDYRLEKTFDKYSFTDLQEIE